MNTRELTGAALDWAVAKCEGVSVEHVNDNITQCLLMSRGGRFNPSTNWAQGGPIIERERIAIDGTAIVGQWMATIYIHNEEPWEMRGPTPLIAAMRCYVASKLGDTVDVPPELQ